jgi:hypothetical protein
MIVFRAAATIDLSLIFGQASLRMRSCSSKKRESLRRLIVVSNLTRGDH